MLTATTPIVPARSNLVGTSHRHIRWMVDWLVMPFYRNRHAVLAEFALPAGIKVLNDINELDYASDHIYALDVELEMNFVHS